ncbi:hypothetical protein QUB08_00485 [Microcoleus sp. BR0-C5]|uniref:hypothetical protein n=1 Tax=Microcoleus sp. BR0-C5 TaxID=2818713 RepID=UPI002FD79656
MFELNNTNPNQSLTTYENYASTNILNSQVIPKVYQDLQRFAAEPDLKEKLKLVFGADYNVQAAQTIVDKWLIGDFSTIPPIELVDRGDIAGANGAFATATNTIYLSKDILTGESADTAALEDLILEEIGHSIDAQVNAIDTPGDEGAIFVAAVREKALSSEELAALKAEDDRAIIVINGSEIAIEKNSTPLGANGTVSGTLSTTDINNPTRSGRYTDQYSLSGLIPGLPVQVEMSSTAFDSYLQLIDVGTAQVIDFDDDSAGNNNSRLTFTPLSGKNYLVRATSYAPGATGSYTLRTVSSGGSTTLPTLSLNHTINSSLSTTDRNNPTRSGAYADDYRLTGVSSGQQVQLNLSSTAFDSYLQVINESTGQVVAFDDNSAGNRNSRLTLTPQSGISYLVRATSYAAGFTGSYTLSAAPVVSNPIISNVQNINYVTGPSSGSFTGRTLYSSQSVSTNNDKYYRFNIEQPGGRLSVGLKDIFNGSADVYLIRDANNNNTVDSGEVLASSEGSSNKSISGSQLDNLSAGTYYVRVKGNASYGIAFNLDQAGNTFSAARPLGDLTAKRQTYMDFLGASTGDDVDYYQFTINGPRKLQLALRTTDISQDTAEKNVTLELFDQNQRRVTLNNTQWDNSRYAQANLAAGTYYAKVTPINNTVSVNYRFVLNLYDQAPSFNITPVFNGSFTSSQRTVINNAINNWKSRIVSGPAGGNAERGFTLNISQSPQPSEQKAYAEAGLQGQGVAIMNIFPYLWNQKSDALATQVIEHELGHAIGFGTSEEFAKLVIIPQASIYSEFTGENAKALNGGRNIPLQGDGDFRSPATWNNRTTGASHWVEGSFPQELMSAVTNDANNNQRNFTLAALKDMGFVLKA